MTEEPSCCGPYYEEYAQTSVSIQRVYVIKFAAFYQGEDEC